MISKPTIFVIGAGGSAPYGLPTGAALRQRICAELRPEFALGQLVQTSGFCEHELLQVRHEFETSGVYSIDTFIAFRPEHQALCETTIAAALLPLENEFALTNVAGRNGNGDWYQLLWNELVSGLSTPDEIAKNPVHFITFNYDRSLEQFLLNCVRSTFNIDLDQAYDYISRLPIKHVYGSLGPFERNVGYKYGGHSDEGLLEMVASARESIKTVPSVRGPADEEACTWVADAHRVVLLGFGFDPTNCFRIGLAQACSGSPDRVSPRHIYASCYHLSREDQALYQANVYPERSYGMRWTPGDCLSALRAIRSQLR